MTLKLHRCSNLSVKVASHPCWRVQRELDAAGIDYEIVKGPVERASREDLQRLSGQRLYPVLEFESGSVYREESADMAARIKSGELSETGLTAPSSEHPGEPAAGDA